MKLTTTVSHDIRFTVEAFWDEEGGMGHANFGTTYDNLPDAIHALSLATAADKTTNWVIVGTVTTTVK